MALSYYFSIAASAETSSNDLEHFLYKVEENAKHLGFNPTLVLNIAFDTDQRREFARRLTTGYPLEDPLLSGVVIPEKGQLWNHDSVSGSCRVIPLKAVVLIVTNKGGTEVCLGFFKYPDLIRDINGKVITATGLNDKWMQKDFLDTPDPRYRKLIRMFADSGFLEFEKDEYA